MKELNKQNKVFGENYQVKISYKLFGAPELKVDNKLVKIILPIKYKNVDKTKIINFILDKLYSRLAEKEVEKIMEKNRFNLKVAPNDYKFQKMDGVLARFLEDQKIIIINPEIVKYNKDILEYVILHEFCQLKFKKQGKSFNKMIEKYIPNYKAVEERVRRVRDVEEICYTYLPLLQS